MLMKKILLIVRQPEVARLFPSGFELLLDDQACVLDAIRVADERISEKCGCFPVKGCSSLLQMVYNVREKRFYRQVAVQAYSKTQSFLNVRENPTLILPDDATIIVIPHGGCSTDWEQPV